MTHFSLFKDFKIRKILQKKQKHFFLLKGFVLNQQIDKKSRFKIMLKIDRLYANLKHNYKNRCMHSTRTRAISRLTNLTKASFKHSLTWGNVCGFKKSS